MQTKFSDNHKIAKNMLKLVPVYIRYTRLHSFLALSNESDKLIALPYKAKFSWNLIFVEYGIYMYKF